MPPAVWAASALVGMTVASVLFCSHWHQIDGDRAAGKLSPLVRLGPDRALEVPALLALLLSSLLLSSLLSLLL